VILFIGIPFKEVIAMSMMLSTLKDKIRYAKEPDNPMLISLWLSAEECHQNIDHAKINRQSRYQEQFYLLLEAFADELNPAHWRCICLDNIYKPICSLQRIAKNEQEQIQIKKLLHELSLTSQYFKHSLQQ